MLRKRSLFDALPLAAVLAVGSCSNDTVLATRFTATLTGADEVPANASTATATATFSAVGGALEYTINVVNISNAKFAHIHGPAPVGQNATIIVNLCGTGAPAPACVSGTGVLATGTASPLAPVSFDSLLVLLRNGNAYVNVHTDDGVTPTNTGPGDLISGEIRGQVAKQ